MYFGKKEAATSLRSRLHFFGPKQNQALMVAAFSHDLGNFGTPGLSGTRYRPHGTQVCLYLKAYERWVAQMDEFFEELHH